jgi:hypothetical protein
MTKNGAKGDYTWERLLAKIYTPKQLEEMDQAQFDAAKSGEIKRLEEGVLSLHLSAQARARACVLPESLMHFDLFALNLKVLLVVSQITSYFLAFSLLTSYLAFSLLTSSLAFSLLTSYFLYCFTAPSECVFLLLILLSHCFLTASSSLCDRRRSVGT